MSSAGSIFYGNIFEVHSGADPVNLLAGYVLSTLQILREDIYVLTRVEPRINFVSNWDEVFLFSSQCPESKTLGVDIRNNIVINRNGGKHMSIIKFIKEEMQIIEERDPAIHSKWEVFLYPSFKVMLHYRLAHKLYKKGHYFLARWVSQRGVRKTGIEIHPGAQIGKGLFIDHGNGVIIGETTIIGDNCTLYQGVTLGGTGKEHGKRHPTIGNNVMISAGAKVLGSFKIGDNSKIGSGSVVLQEVPPNSTVVGVPGRVVERKKKTAPQETMDHGNLPNPVEEDIMKLQQTNEQLARRIYALEEEISYWKTTKKTRVDQW